jgi:hypothetical protein
MNFLKTLIGPRLFTDVLVWFKDDRTNIMNKGSTVGNNKMMNIKLMIRLQNYDNDGQQVDDKVPKL